jgi:hypothetical protein
VTGLGGFLRVFWNHLPAGWGGEGCFRAQSIKFVSRSRRFGGGLELAVRLGKFCRNGPGLWLRFQQTYDLWHAERALAHAIAQILSHRLAARRPVALTRPCHDPSSGLGPAGDRGYGCPGRVRACSIAI